MCVQTATLRDGTIINCRKCWQCRERKVDDWVGRCVAESKIAASSHSITLTYGQSESGSVDHLRAAILTYSDVQRMFWHLRADGYKFKYFAVGEYGSMKGRSHWHLVMFWEGEAPPHELSTTSAKRFHNKYWPHGFQHWEKPNAKSIRYVCKYLQKDIGKDERQGHLAMSKKPPLGHEYFQRLALKYVDQGLAPQTLEYKFNEIRNADRSPKKFIMSGVTAQNFLRKYVDEWDRKHGWKTMPNSELVEEYLDAEAAKLPRLSLELERMEREAAANREMEKQLDIKETEDGEAEIRRKQIFQDEYCQALKEVERAKEFWQGREERKRKHKAETARANDENRITKLRAG